MTELIANASSYVLEGSNDGVSWEELKSLENQAEGNHRIDNSNVSGDYQYVRIYGTSRNLTYGYSIYEIEIYGDTIGVISSIEENHNLLSSVYPNPSSGQFVFESQKRGKIEIKNNHGVSLEQKTHNSGVTPFGEQLPAGVYILEFVDEFGSEKHKLIKN